MNIILYSTVSNLRQIKQFSTIEDLRTWLKRHKNRSFYISWDDGDVYIGFIPMYDDNKEEEETVEDLDQALKDSIIGISRRPWMETEVEAVKKNLHMTIPEMIRKKVVSNRTYWEIYNLLACNGYEYDHRIGWKKIDWKTRRI